MEEIGDLFHLNFAMDEECVVTVLILPLFSLINAVRENYCSCLGGY